jgi:hypothetical protein
MTILCEDARGYMYRCETLFRCFAIKIGNHLESKSSMGLENHEGHSNGMCDYTSHDIIEDERD